MTTSELYHILTRTSLSQPGSEYSSDKSSPHGVAKPTTILSVSFLQSTEFLTRGNLLPRSALFSFSRYSSTTYGRLGPLCASTLNRSNCVLCRSTHFIGSYALTRFAMYSSGQSKPSTVLRGVACANEMSCAGRTRDGTVVASSNVYRFVLDTNIGQADNRYALYSKGR